MKFIFACFWDTDWALVEIQTDYKNFACFTPLTK
jgi:hypothetical protein